MNATGLAMLKDKPVAFQQLILGKHRDRKTQTQRDCLFHRPTALGHHRRPRQPAGADAQLRPHGAQRDRCALRLYLPAGLCAGSLLPADRPLCHQYRRLPQRHRAGPGHGNAGQVFPRWRLYDRLHRQVAPGRCRPGASGAARRVRLLARRQPAGVHLRRVRYAALRHGGQAGEAAGLSRRCLDGRRHSLCRCTTSRTLLSLHLLFGAAPSEPSGRLSGACRLSRAVHRSLDAAGPGRIGRLLAPAPGRLLRDGQAAGRGVGPAAGCAAQPRSAGEHGRALHLGPRLSLQDPQRRIQALLP